MNHEEIYLGRQPILDRNTNVLGYEILFRSGHSLTADIDNVSQAAVSSILTTLSDFGLNEVVGKRHTAFFNVNAAILKSAMVELLPKDQVVLELLETSEIDDEVINRCRELKTLGFRLALDDFVYKPSYDPLLEWIDIVKVDLLVMTPALLEETLVHLKRFPLTLLAEKVEDYQQFDPTRALGFHLFQGYYFAHPVVISGKRVDPENITVMKLMNQILRDADLNVIEKTFKESPSLSYNLLRLLNSVSSGMKEKISSVGHAIVLLGRERLNRWAQILLFTLGSTPGYRNPLLATAVMRGRFMELMVEKGALGGRKSSADLAFMTGILSLIEALLMRPMAKILDQLSLVDEVYRALVDDKGELAHLLQLVKKIEKSDYAAIDLVADRCQLKMDRVIDAEQEATVWTKGLLQSF